MNTEYMCYCGLYCENCVVPAKITPAAKTLHDVIKAAGFDKILGFIPGGDSFWPFLKNMAENGICVNCRSGGNPGCKVRLCAKEKGVERCALCESYPCGLFDDFFTGYPLLEHDNALLKEKGLAEWGKLQDARRKEGFTYSDYKAAAKP